MRLSGELLRRGGEGAQPLANRPSLAQPREHPGRRLPSRDQLLGRLRLAAQQSPLEPVGHRLRLTGSSAHEREQLLAGCVGQARARQREEAAAGGGSREGDRRFERDWDAEALEHPRV